MENRDAANIYSLTLPQTSFAGGNDNIMMSEFTSTGHIRLVFNSHMIELFYLGNM